MADLTPMRQQYQDIKAQHQDCMLLFRLGDFYEMFDDDAKLAARELDLTLTTRDRNKPESEQTPMCGVPYHSAEAYIGRLIAKGYKVAICEQAEDPALAKGLVRREVIRVISPGTVTESSMLEESRSNYLGALFLEGDAGAAAFCDISTGEVCVASFPQDGAGHLVNEMGRFSPREVLLSRRRRKTARSATFSSGSWSAAWSRRGTPRLSPWRRAAGGLRSSTQARGWRPWAWRGMPGRSGPWAGFWTMSTPPRKTTCGI